MCGLFEHELNVLSQTLREQWEKRKVEEESVERKLFEFERVGVEVATQLFDARMLVSHVHIAVQVHFSQLIAYLMVQFQLVDGHFIAIAQTESIRRGGGNVVSLLGEPIFIHGLEYFVQLLKGQLFAVKQVSQYVLLVELVERI